ncbi:unnamed protein product [Rotaria sordida]|uniref:Uncharacterized protein n=1 Tax=Rotaria sordida TaxID=392033 RepID=A0A818JAT1_9BILA|nr:unnamed protein product [Rotaria sordida]
MYFLFFHEIVFIILFTNLYRLVHSNNNDIPSKITSKNPNGYRLSTVTVVKDNETHKEPFNIIVRMIAFGIRRSDDDDENNEQQKLVNKNLPMTNNHKFFLSSNEDSDRFKLQKNTRLLLLPLMIRMLLERIAEHTNIIEKSNNSQKFYEIYSELKIICRLRDTHKKFNVIRFDSSSVNNKKNHEETIKLLS